MRDLDVGSERGWVVCGDREDVGRLAGCGYVGYGRSKASQEIPKSVGSPAATASELSYTAVVSRAEGTTGSRCAVSSWNVLLRPPVCSGTPRPALSPGLM